MRILPVCFVWVLVVSGVDAEIRREHERISESLHERLRQLAAGEEMAILVSLKNTFDAPAYRVKSAIHKKQLLMDLKNRAERDQKNLRHYLKQQKSTDVRSLWINNTIALRADPELISQLSGFPEVESIRADDIIHLGDLPSGQPGSPQWHLDAIGVPVLWALGLDGSGVVVACMDTGVDLNHPDLTGRWRGGPNSWKDLYQSSPLPYDPLGHGTAIMGIMVGGNFGGTAIGAAPGAQWIAVRIFDDNGDAPYSKIHEGFQWLLDPDGNPDTQDSPDIVNNSWGMHFGVNQCISEFQQDIEILKTAGIAVVFAAGNSGPLPSTSVSPANNQNNVSVGAVGETGLIAPFSSRGPTPCNDEIFPTLSAPGVNIKTADLTGGGAIPDSYVYVSGTSFAAALVSGSMALLIGAMPDKDINQIEKAMILSASDAGQLGPDYLYGHGMINAVAAYEFLASLCISDLDQNYEVGLSDLELFAAQWMMPGCEACQGDVNQDGAVDYLDFYILSRQFGNNTCR
ncbi:MAG TPA: S8 family serine peptidase [Anaerohalosphaeraceae bacterium]|nr:S8 family serine peptidase [Anaerohalosphaeraceae bacterium]